MKKIFQKRLSLVMVMIAIAVGGITTGAEAAVTWLGAINVEAPTKVAVDSVGRVYVTESKKNRLSIYDRNGNLLKKLYGLESPTGIAVDKSGNIYIGNSRTNNVAGIGNVKIYDPNNNYAVSKIIGGVAPPEIIEPNAIGLTSNGNIYIVDTNQHLVRVYNFEENPDGGALFTFGGYDAGTRDANGVPIAGSAEGKFNVPVDIAVDEAAGELYILDLGAFVSLDNSNNPQLQRGARVQVFDLEGNVLSGRTFGTWGFADGEMITPVGIAIDKLGVLNITDSLRQVVHRFNTDGNFIDKIDDPDHPLIIPKGVAVGQDDRIFICSQSPGTGLSPTVEIYGLADYTSLGVTPKTITLSGYAGGTAAGKDLTISNSGSGQMNWWTEKATDSQWITLSKQSGQTGAEASEPLTVGADLSSLTEGTYTGKFKVITGGAEEEVTVNLEVGAGAVLELTPLELTYSGQAGGSQPLAQTVTITLTGGAINWAATSNAPSWLSIDPAAGSAGQATQASVSVDITGLTAGQYESSITVTAEGATGSPSEVKVTLSLISAGRIEVSTNTEDAKWSISGEAEYQGEGTQWSQLDAPSGQYLISFGEISGYLKPQDQPFEVVSGRTTSIDVQYKDLRATKKIIAGSGSGNKNPAEIKILNTEGITEGADFMAFSLEYYGVNVAAGDIDGDGTDEIIAGAGENKSNPARVKIFKADGSEIPGADFIAFETRYGANVAAGDIDGDGKSEIIVGTAIRKGHSSQIRVFKYIDGVITDTGINSIVDTSRYGVYVASGDTDGDGKDEIITGNGPDKESMATVRIFKADISEDIGNWKAAEISSIIVGAPKTGAVVAVGDLNGDGKAEILAGSSNGLNIRTYSSDGSPYGVEITETDRDLAKMYKKGAGIAAGDTDEDGIAEIVIGTGSDKKSPAEIRIYSAEGTLMNSFTAFSEKGGVNVAVGKVQ